MFPVLEAFAKHAPELGAIETALGNLATIESPTTDGAIRECWNDFKAAGDLLTPIFADIALSLSDAPARAAAIHANPEVVHGRLIDRILEKIGAGGTTTSGAPAQPWDGSRITNVAKLFFKFAPILWPLFSGGTPFPIPIPDIFKS